MIFVAMINSYARSRRAGFSFLLLATFLLSGPAPVLAQQRYGLEFAAGPAVVAGTDTLRNPWAGGMNTPAFSKMDFDRDGTPDLLVWDGRSQRGLTFVSRAGRWRYAPAYEAALPAPDSGKLTYFALLRDYDGDGLPDLFINANQYVRLYRQETTPGVGVGFRFVRVGAPYLQTEPVPAPQLLTNVLVAPWTTWDLADVDGDGDLDLLTYEFLGRRLVLQRNQAGPGAVPVFREDPTWGGVAWCGRRGQQYSFLADGTICRPGGPQHSGNPASSIALPDLDGDGDRDILLGQEYVSDLALLTNQGSPAQELFTASSLVSPLLANSAHPAQLLHAPAAFYEDVTFDQVPDLLVSPWLVIAPPISPEDLFDTRRSVHLFAGGPGGLTFQQSDFLQDGMIDAGENAAPTLGDLDGDGDLDLLVGNQGDYEPNPSGQPTPRSYRAQLRFYRNIGTRQRAVFRLEDTDFAGFGTADRRALVPVLTDLDGNGTADLVVRFSPDPLGAGVFPLSYVLNVAALNQTAVFPLSNLQQLSFQIGGQRGPRDLPCFYDVDGDGRRDLLLGTNQWVNAVPTVLHYLRNRGGAPSTAFVLADADFGRLPAALKAVTGCAPAVADLDGDGRPELLTAADDGELRVWPQLLAQPTASTPDQFGLVRNDLTTVFGPARLGRNLVLTTGDLDADGRAEVLVGIPGGGVRLLRSQPTGLVVARPEFKAFISASLSAFPNPVASDAGTASLLTVQWSGVSGPVSVALLDVLGRVVRQTAAAAGATQLSAAGLPAGIYSVRVQPAGGGPGLRQRLLVSRVGQ